VFQLALSTGSAGPREIESQGKSRSGEATLTPAFETSTASAKQGAVTSPSTLKFPPSSDFGETSRRDKEDFRGSEKSEWILI
jgi:hypothetical protein